VRILKPMMFLAPAILILAAVCPAAQAGETLRFIESNNAENALKGRDRLFTEVQDPGGARAPSHPNRLDPGESFIVSGGPTVDDLISMTGAVDPNVGIGLRRFEPGESEAFVTFIPTPSAVLLSSIGMAIVGWLKRRKTL